MILKSEVNHKWCASVEGCAAWNKKANRCLASGDVCPNPGRKLADG